MKKIEDPILQEIIRKISTALNPEKIFLFGSRSKGTENSASDYDIAVLMPATPSEKPSLMDKGHQALWGVSASVDIVIIDSAEFMEFHDVPNTMPSIVMNEGVELHVA